jgi:formate-dependent nitrite reductase membrane component NrfD
MTGLAAAEHFVRDPHWTWYILFYFFFAGIAGGSYTIATLLRLRGEPKDEPTARLGYYVTFAVLLMCPPLLVVDLGQPLRFWHMMWNTTPGVNAPNFKHQSPMSVGVWGLLGFNAFAAISFVEALVRDGKLRFGPAQRLVGLLDGPLGRVVMILGTAFGLFIAGYTGVLLAVSNQPLWSDTWTLGGLFLASGLSSAVAVLTLLSRFRRGADASHDVLHPMEAVFTVLEVVMIGLFVLTLMGTGALELTFGFPWILLWLVALVGLLPGIAALLTARRAAVSGDQGSGHGSVAVATHTTSTVATLATPVLILVGVLALRAAIIFPVHYYNWPGQ